MLSYIAMHIMLCAMCEFCIVLCVVTSLLLRVFRWLLHLTTCISS